MSQKYRTKDLTLATMPRVYDHFLPVKRTLQRRGATFLKVETNTWRIHIPTHLIWRPFFDFLEEQDCITAIGPIKIRTLPS